MKTARQIATEALLRVEEGGAWSNLALGSRLDSSGLEARDRAFASAIYYGTLSRLLTLNACIAACSSKAPHKLDPSVRVILQTAVYQLLFMPSVPEHAVLSEAVNLTKRMRKASASGFVNAVLRAFLRSGKSVPLPKGPPEKQMEIEYSCPAETVSMLLACYGEEETRVLLEDSLKPPPLFLRVNTVRISGKDLTRRLSQTGIAVEIDPQIPGCLMLREQGAVAASAEYREGLFHIQDRSSQLCALLLGARPGERVLDCCAAPGGKSFTIAQSMENQGELYCADLHPHRVGLIEKRAAELGLSIIRPFAADMTSWDESLGEFDRVLCDVPCSGLGVIRRRPEIKYKKQEYGELEKLQYNILKTASNYLKKGGTLLYSTCTIRPEENEEMVSRFLIEHPNFAPAPLAGSGESGRLILPGEDGGDGFFLSAMSRLT